MWPWSTISRLKRDLQRATDDGYKFADRCGRLIVENEQLAQRWTALNESYETQGQELNMATLRVEGYRVENNRLEEMWNKVLLENRNLSTQLSKALVRDPKTGRLTKWNPTQPGVTVGGSASGEVGH